MKEGKTMQYVALFRGLNVGGKNIVKMAALKAMLEGLGLQGVHTYIQSGNALFESQEAEETLCQRVEEGFFAAFGFTSVVILRTREQLYSLVQGLPFSQEEQEAARQAAPEAETLYCYLLRGNAPEEGLSLLQKAEKGRDRCVGKGREIYLLCHESIRDCKLVAGLSKLLGSSTCRNLKTLRKLLSLMEGEA